VLKVERWEGRVDSWPIGGLWAPLAFVRTRLPPRHVATLTLIAGHAGSDGQGR
jgi:hypothetical protein